MVKTGARAGSLLGLLEQVGLRRAAEPPRAPRLEDVPDFWHERILDTYRRLGGRLAEPRLRPGAWDLAFTDGLVLELDEELHFNRYRRLTLESERTSCLPWQPTYLAYCESHEDRCLAAAQWGKRWTNPSCESLFGPADLPGVFGEAGAPRWKQRALYDLIKDAVASARSSVRLVRIATMDEVDGVSVGAALEGRAALDLEGLRALVAERST